MKKDIFITGTFRNEWSRAFNARLCAFLEEAGFSCHLPQRDTDQSGDRRRTFAGNIAGIENCRALLATGAKTQTANWGLEIGYAFALKKPVFILTDAQHPAALMPEGAARQIFIEENLDNLDGYGGGLIQALKAAL